MPSEPKARAASIFSTVDSNGDSVGADAGPGFFAVGVGGGGGDCDLFFEDFGVGGVGHGADDVEDAH